MGICSKSVVNVQISEAVQCYVWGPVQCSDLRPKQPPHQLITGVLTHQDKLLSSTERRKDTPEDAFRTERGDDFREDMSEKLGQSRAKTSLDKMVEVQVFWI